MGSIKQKYFSHDINRRFKFLSIISLLFLGVGVIALVVGLANMSFINVGINLFVIASAFIAYRTAKSLRPQMAAYYFSIGFLVFSVGNSSFWVETYLEQSFSQGLFLLTLLLIVNMIVAYVAAYKAYQIWLTLLLSLVGMLFYNIFQIDNLEWSSIANLIMVNLTPLIFILVVSLLLSYMYEIRTDINNHYKNKYKTEKRHLMKVISNIDAGYASFKLKYDNNRKPVNAKIDHYNQNFIDILKLSNISIDDAKISDLNADGEVIFGDYSQILLEFDRKKAFHYSVSSGGQQFTAYIFAIENNQLGMMIHKA